MNNKGFTLVETLVSFALVSVISIFLFQIVIIVKNIYLEKGVKTEMVLEQSNLSNSINRDITNNDKSGNYIKKVLKSGDTITLTYSDGTTSALVVDSTAKTVTYDGIVYKFLAGTNIGTMTMNFDYETTSTPKLVSNGVCYITIPITYKDEDNSYDIRIVYRFNSTKTTITG